MKNNNFAFKKTIKNLNAIINQSDLSFENCINGTLVNSSIYCENLIDTKLLSNTAVQYIDSNNNLNSKKFHNKTLNKEIKKIVNCSNIYIKNIKNSSFVNCHVYVIEKSQVKFSIPCTLDNSLSNKSSNNVESNKNIIPIKNNETKELKIKNINDDIINIYDTNSIIYYGTNIQQQMFVSNNEINTNLLKLKNYMDLSVLIKKESKKLDKMTIKEPNILMKILFPSCRINGGEEYYKTKINSFKKIIKFLEKDLRKRLETIEDNLKYILAYKKHLIEKKDKFETYIDKIEKYFSNDIPNLKLQIDNQNILEKNRFETNVNLIEKKINDLKITKTVSEQLLVTLDIIETNTNNLKNKIVSIITTTLPIFNISLFIQITTDNFNTTNEDCKIVEDLSVASYKTSISNLKDTIHSINNKNENNVKNLLNEFNDVEKIISTM